MGKIHLLDCTLRDGGYINDWAFGESAIKGIVHKLEATGIEMIEVGFMKEGVYNPDKTLFPTVQSFLSVLEKKQPGVLYVGMIDMGTPVPFSAITPYDGKSIDGIRVIFKKSKMREGYEYCKYIKEMGYKVFVNFVNTDHYTDEEFVEGIKFFSSIKPDGVTIVDTFGTMKRKQILRLVSVADKALDKETMLCYHAHNNLQQAFGNAEAIVEMELERDVCIDACVFGMGRGAGNLNLEIFAEFLNDNYGKSYRIEPMLEIMDDYLTTFYNTKFWGYSLPLYLSATLNCHPNYAIYYAEKNNLPVKAFNEILGSISAEDKVVFNEGKAEEYYQKYLENYVEDKEEIEELTKAFEGKEILLIAPGKSISGYEDKIQEILQKGVCAISINFYDEKFRLDYIFCSNMKRAAKIPKDMNDRIIATSNTDESLQAKYVVNFSSYTSRRKEIFANGGLMALKVLIAAGVKAIKIAGMDGYSDLSGNDYFQEQMELEHFMEADLKNRLIQEELLELKKHIQIEFITPSKYQE